MNVNGEVSLTGSKVTNPIVTHNAVVVTASGYNTPVEVPNPNGCKQAIVFIDSTQTFDFIPDTRYQSGAQSYGIANKKVTGLVLGRNSVVVDIGGSPIFLPTIQNKGAVDATVTIRVVLVP